MTLDLIIYDKRYKDGYKSIYQTFGRMESTFIHTNWKNKKKIMDWAVRTIPSRQRKNILAIYIDGEEIAEYNDFELKPIEKE